MTRPSVIAIDGPAGSGKSTISHELAQRFGYAFVDTGAFYRALTYVVLKAAVDLTNHDDVMDAVRHITLETRYSEGKSRIIANGEDITDELTSHMVDTSVSIIAKIPEVREMLLPLQRQVATVGNVIMAGRDIGTTVLPDASLKLYIDASLQERARRRYEQITATGEHVQQEKVESAMAERDKLDSERSVAPLSMAADAIYIMTDHKSLEEVVQYISEIIEEYTNKP